MKIFLGGDCPALISKLNGKNKIKVINSWAVEIIRYGAGVLDWRVDELKELDRKTRKFLTMYKGFHPTSDIDRLYVSKNKGERGVQRECLKESL